jgi:hypothetical protein
MASPELVQAGEVIADLARKNSAWSERIPASVHTVAGGGEVVLIVAGGAAAPHAITFEAPNAPYWKHPVFGHGPREDWHWAKQDPRRFLLPAAEDGADKAVEVYAKVVDRWAEELGFTEE